MIDFPSFFDHSNPIRVSLHHINLIGSAKKPLFDLRLAFISFFGWLYFSTHDLIANAIENRKCDRDRQTKSKGEKRSAIFRISCDVSLFPKLNTFCNEKYNNKSHSIWLHFGFCACIIFSTISCEILHLTASSSQIEIVGFA